MILETNFKLSFTMSTRSTLQPMYEKSSPNPQFVDSNNQLGDSQWDSRAEDNLWCTPVWAILRLDTFAKARGTELGHRSGSPQMFTLHFPLLARPGSSRGYSSRTAPEDGHYWPQVW